MQAFDTSSIVYAWDNYPVQQFPGLWEWVAGQITSKELVMPSVAFEEVEDISPDCAAWLKHNGLHQLPVIDDILQDALRIKRLLGIVEDKYNPRGVGENDILIIATARAHAATLISNEEKQAQRPDNRARYKIPSVCAMSEVSVRCMNFTEFIKNSAAVFR